MFESNNETIKNLIKFRPPLYNEKLPIILFWNEKSGCTSFSKWFFFQIGLLEKALEHNPFIHLYRAQVYCNSTIYLGEMETAILSSKKDIVKLVRNPYTRAVSSFLHILHYGTPNNSHNAKFFQEFTRIIKMNNFKGISFKQFLYALKKVGCDILSIDGHIAQQYIEGEEHLVKQYIYLEDLEKHIFYIEDYYNLLTSPIDLLVQSPHHKSSLIKNEDSLEKYSEKILSKDIISNSHLPSYEKFYDEETIDLCTELFKQDLKFYKYKKFN